MKIAIVAPPHFALGQFLTYGGTERVVTLLVQGLIARGHDLLVFAPSSSSFEGARVVPILDPVDAVTGLHMYYQRNAAMAGLCAQWLRDNPSAAEVVHNHCEGMPTHLIPQPMVHTNHNGWVQAAQHWTPHFPNVTHVAISRSEEAKMRAGGVAAQTVYNNVDVVPLSQASTGLTKHGYAAMIGRFDRIKGFDLGIRACLRAGVPVKIAAKAPDEGQLTFFEQEIHPLLEANPEMVEWVGAVNDAQKAVFLGEAVVEVVPNRWEEPFGLVLVEALACGTPVVGPRTGSIPEVVGEYGVTFERPEDEDVYVERLAQVIRLAFASPFSPEACRERALSFATGMVEGYERVYQCALQA